MAQTRRHYGLGGFLFDVILGLLTGGIWWAFLLFRFFRNNS